MKVVIVASLSQMDDIYKVVNICQKLGIEVHYPRKQPDKEFSKIVEEYFEKISKADLILAIEKEDGSFGNSCTYELTFAKYLNKPIQIIRKEEL